MNANDVAMTLAKQQSDISGKPETVTIVLERDGDVVEVLARCTASSYIAPNPFTQENVR